MADRKVWLGAVRVFDDAVISDSKEQAVKVLEEAAEVVEAYKNTMRITNRRGVRSGMLALAAEIADVVQAACNLAFVCGIDMRAALDRCEQRNRGRGRVS